MESFQRSSMCSLAYGLLAEGGCTVDAQLLGSCRPHHKPPCSLVPVASHPLPLPKGSTHFCPRRHVKDIHFTPHDGSLLLTCCTDDALLLFDMHCEAFFSELPLSAGTVGSIWRGEPSSLSCVHVSRYPGTPLLFTGSSNGDVLVFDMRISGLRAEISGSKASPALRLAAAHNGGLCGIRTGLDLHPHLFLTGGREDGWLRLFDIRFPFHYSSGDCKWNHHVPYPVEATHLGPNVDGNRLRSFFMAFDVSSDGTLLAAAVTQYCYSSPGKMQGEDGETILISLRDGARTLKTIASADACATEFIQFSPNGKYLLQTGGVRTQRCELCWRCRCVCSCASEVRRDSVSGSCKVAINREGTWVLDDGDGRGLCTGSSRCLPVQGEYAREDGLASNNGSTWVRRCAYHRAQLLNLVQSNRTVSLKSPADGAVAFADSFCLRCHPMGYYQNYATAAEVPLQTADAPHGGPGQPQIPRSGSACGLPPLIFTLHGPRSRHVQRCRRRFWDKMSRIQTEAVALHRRNVASTLTPTAWSAQPSNDHAREELAEGQDVNSSLEACSKRLAQQESAKAGIDCEPGEGTSSEKVITDEGSAESRCLLFPLLHPQLSQFVAACGPLHPAFVRAEASTAPFTCRLWGGLVVGFGGSTTDRKGRRRLYEGLKLWDSTTGVVLSWTESSLASEDNLKCIAPLPDVSTGVLATGGSLFYDLHSTGDSAPPEGLTFWSVKSRDNLLLSALEGSLTLEVESDEGETPDFHSDD
ncbi:hypothetical protein Efla_001757 [Eimeria flavescens]